MYSVDDKDEVMELATAPQCDIGAPLPFVLADDHKLLLAYILSEPDPDWDGTTVEVVTPESPDEAIAIVTFLSPYCHIFGPPDDEAFSGHPLATRGLKPYAVAEVEQSSWIRGLETMNAVHPYHSPALFAAYRHFVFAFHDSTFECVAKDFTVEVLRGLMRSALHKMTEKLTGHF